MKFTSMLSLSFVLLLLCAVLAQAQAAPAPLTLQDCVKAALTNQVDVLTGAQAVVGAQARVTKAKSDYYPQVSINNNMLSAGNGDRVADMNGTSITVSQNIYDGGLRELGAKQAKIGVTQNQFALARTRQTVTFSVTKAFFDALRARRLAEVADARVKYNEGQLALVRGRIEAGAGAPVDELPVVAQLANARVDQLAAQNKVRTSLLDLQNSMGLEPSPAFAIADPGELPVTALQPLETYLQRALASRPDVQQSAAGVSSAEVSVKTSKVSLLPRVVAGGSYGRKLDGSLDDWSVTGGLAYDLFDGKRNRSIYDEARSNLTSAQLRAAQTRKDIAAQVQDAYLNHNNAAERMAAAALSQQAAQQNFDAQQARFQEGLAIPLDLVNAQVELTTAQSNAVQARYDYYVAQAQLAYAVGTQGESDAQEK